MDRRFLALGGVFALLSVALGAFGAHALRGRLSEEMLAVFQTGVQYQTMHALALMVVGIAWAGISSKLLRLAGWGFVVGILIFSGSLYALALSGARWLGAITPLGGLSFLAAWILFVSSCLHRETKSRSGS